MKIVKLNDVCEIIAGQSPPSEFYNDQGIGLPFFQGKADFGELHPSVRMWCSRPQKVAEAGDILISVRAPVGPTNLADRQCCIGRGLSAIRPSGKVDTKFLLQYFKAIEPKLANMGNGSTFSAITQKDLRTIEIPLPPLGEQQRIAAILDKADMLRAKRRTAVAKLDSLLQSTFLHMFGDPVTNPMGWEVWPISKITDVKTGSTPSREKEGNYGGEVHWVKTTEVDWGIITDTEETVTKQGIESAHLKIYPKDSVLIAMYGQGKTRGKSAVLGINATVNQACAVLLPSNRLKTEYISVLLRHCYKNLRELGRGGNQPNLNLSLVKSFEIPLPPIELQARFAETVKIIQKIQNNHTKHLDGLDNLFHALQQRAFTGQL